MAADSPHCCNLLLLPKPFLNLSFCVLYLPAVQLFAGHHLDGVLVHHVDVNGQVLEAFHQAPPGTLHSDNPEDLSHEKGANCELVQ